MNDQTSTRNTVKKRCRNRQEKEKSTTGEEYDRRIVTQEKIEEQQPRREKTCTR
jgi:hypothetical protein